MTLTSSDQIIQFTAWLIAMIELVLSTYILIINTSQAANRNSSILLLIASISSFAIGRMVSAQDASQSLLSTLVLAMFLPSMPLLFFMAIIAILKPEWERSRLRWIGRLVYLLVLLPVAVAVTDYSARTAYWYTGIPADYSGGYLSLSQYASGSYAGIGHVFPFKIIPVLCLLFLGSIALFDRRASTNTRRLAWFLLIAQAGVLVISQLVSSVLLPAAVALSVISILALSSGLAAMQQMISERRAQEGSLQARLTALILVVTVPFLLAISSFITWRTRAWSDESLLLEIIITLGICMFLLLALSWYTIRQALQPIRELTNIASAIATGDLTRVAVVQSTDETGALAHAFNSMTTQLRESITNLERRVAERTRDLERRAVQLQVAAEVANQVAAIRDPVLLMDHVVRLISEKFNFYHSGIYLVDDTRNYAVLRAASSEGGKRMLERGHKLAVGQVGIVGHVAGQGEPRIALDVGNDAVYFDNPDLPQTRSELALPLKAREEIIGVLDVQSTKASAFTEEDIEILQILSDQIAVAIENARLLSRSEEIIQELNSVYQTQVNQSWKSRLEPHPVAYAYRNGRVYKEPRPNPPGEQEGAEPNLLRLPVTLRNQPLGWITLRRSSQARAWSQEEIEFASSIVSQLALALENARLMEENRRRAQQEEMIGNVSAKTQGMLDVESVVKAALEEIGKSLGLSKVQIILGEQERIN